jgi:hypothetical protein
MYYTKNKLKLIIDLNVNEAQNKNPKYDGDHNYHNDYFEKPQINKRL